MSGWLYLSLIQSDGAAVAVAPLMRKRIACAQLVARRGKEEAFPGTGDHRFQSIVIMISRAS